MSRNAIISKNAVSIGPYSHAVDADGLVFVSGQAGVDVAATLVAGGVAEQTQQTFDNLRAVLETAGLSLDDVQKVNVYLANMDDFSAMNEVYAQQFSAPYPARTTIGVASLPLGALVEIEMIAKRR